MHNKHKILIGIGILLIFAVGIIVFIAQNKIATEKISYPVVSTLPTEYTVETAIEDGCYVDVHGEIYNNDIMNEFIEKVAQNQSASIRTIIYTMEGDPIITDFSYNCKYFSVTQDNTRDRYGSKSVIYRKLNNLVSYYNPEMQITFFYITDLAEITYEDFEKGINGVLLKTEQ